MSLALFHNALRILLNLERFNLQDGGVISVRDDAAWLRFSNDPFRWFIAASDEQKRALWNVIESRQPERLKVAP